MSITQFRARDTATDTWMWVGAKRLPPCDCPHCGAPAGPDHHAPTRSHLGTAISECDANRISQDGP